MVEVTEAIGRAIVWSEHASIEQVDQPILADSTELLDAWIACRGNQSAMAEALNCHRNTIRNRMNQLSESLPGPGNTTEKFRTLLKAHLLLKP